MSTSDPPKGTPPAAPNRLALLVGVNKYRSKDIPTLKGCVNDVMAMKNVLRGKYGFAEAEIHTLTDDQATYSKITDEFKSHLIAKSRPLDIVVFQFSGHGSRFEVGSDPSGFEETIVPYDSRDTKNLDITGRALSSLLKELGTQTKNVTVVLDSCH